MISGLAGEKFSGSFSIFGDKRDILIRINNIVKNPSKSLYEKYE